MLQARLFIEEIGNNFPSGSYCCTGGFGPCLRQLQFSSVQLLSHVQFSATPWTAACQASLSITHSQSLLKLMSITLVMPSNHLILCRPLFLPPSMLPASGAFQMSQFFVSGGQSTGVDCHFLLQGIFPTEGLNPGLPHCRQTLYSLSHQGNPQIHVERVYLQFSRSVVSNSLRPHGLQHARLPCPSPTPRACSDSCPSRW